MTGGKMTWGNWWKDGMGCLKERWHGVTEGEMA